jgi:DNA-directed RNA polymerase specialized sigma24 family protein
MTLAKRRIDSSYRAALLLAYQAGHSYAEIAKAANVSRQAVRQLLNRST